MSFASQQTVATMQKVNYQAVNMLSGVTALLGFVLASTVQCQLVFDPQCISPISVTVQSSRNQTGKWTTKVGFEHRKNSEPWSVNTDICESKDTIRIVTTISSIGTPKEVPPGYEFFSGVGYYKFQPNGTSWPRARQICTEEGSHLVIINSEREADVMAQLFARFPKHLINAAGNDNWAWVGAHEMGVDGEYFTIFGEPLSTTGFMRWFKGQPDDKDVDTAVVTHRISGALGDAFPAWTAAFICELDI